MLSVLKLIAPWVWCLETYMAHSFWSLVYPELCTVCCPEKMWELKITTPRAASAVQTSPSLNLLITLLCDSFPWTSHSLSKFLSSYRIFLSPHLIPFRGALQCLQAYQSDHRFSSFSQSNHPLCWASRPAPASAYSFPPYGRVYLQTHHFSALSSLLRIKSRGSL